MRLDITEQTDLFKVLASRGSRSRTRLGVGITLLNLGTFGHHDSETNISTLGVLVTVLTRVDSRGIRTVSFESLEWVEVLGSTRWGRVPGGVNILLGVVIPKFVVVLSVFETKVGGNACSEWLRGESGGTDGEEGNNGDDLLELFIGCCYSYKRNLLGKQT